MVLFDPYRFFVKPIVSSHKISELRRCICQSANPLQKTWRLSDWLLWLLYQLFYWYCLTSCWFMQIGDVTNTHAQSLVQFLTYSVGLAFSTGLSPCMIYHITWVELLTVDCLHYLNNYAGRNLFWNIRNSVQLLLLSHCPDFLCHHHDKMLSVRFTADIAVLLSVSLQTSDMILP